ncbi:MAG: class I SAM-dependent methyltransferase [Myxococcota bacterium]|jgi:16S rRNA (guanine527-N7)-methyltransferase|nr:class I SAM-dependent methyltransferase [Myxococcota bacterium]
MNTNTRSALGAIEAFIHEHQLDADEGSMARFASYLDALLEAQHNSSIIGPLSPEQIATELICDSLQIMRVGPLAALVDIGSGAGFPGLPLKIMQPSLSLTLVEPRRQRHAFLQHCVALLKLEQVQCCKVKVEQWQAQDIGLLCSKAFTTLPRWLALGQQRLGPKGQLSVLCSKDDWLQHCADTIGTEPLHHRQEAQAQCEPYPLPTRQAGHASTPREQSSSQEPSGEHGQAPYSLIDAREYRWSRGPARMVLRLRLRRPATPHV